MANNPVAFGARRADDAPACLRNRALFTDRHRTLEGSSADTPTGRPGRTLTAQ